MSEGQQAAAPRASSVSRDASRPWPGASMALAMALLSGIACWFWLMPLLTADPRSEAASVSVADLAEVADADLAGAFSTIDLPASALARLKDSSRTCAQRLAWVTLVRGSGPEPESVRVRSGNYFSPAIKLTATPVRVAVPFPAPYESGEGSLTVLGADAGVTVALAPPWSIAPKAGAATHRVSWRPTESCKRG